MRKVTGLMIILVLVIASTSFAAVCPQVTTLGTLNGGHRFEPLRVAVESSGKLYVSDAQNDLVNVYSPLGELVNSIYVKYPLGVAVDDSGKVYVGSIDKHGTDKGMVTVYNSSLSQLYTLGSGLGQFEKPLGIATDAERVYVADTKANVIRVFDISSGAYLFQFGGAGSAPGNLVKPDNVIVDQATGNLLISDKALVYNDCSYVPAGQTCDPNSQGLGAKLHEFTRDGAWVRSFGTHGFEDVAGTIALIGGLTIDNAGRIIVSDRTKHNLHVFDSTGNPVCTIDYDGSPGSLPQGMAATVDGRLYVGASGRVIELGLDTYTKMVVSPEELAFAAQECGSQPAGRTVTVSNEGPGNLDFTITSDSAWLGASTSAGTISGVGSEDVGVSVDKSGLNVGVHTGVLTVSSVSGEQTVTVTLEVLPPSPLNVTPSSLSFSANGENPPAQTLGIEISGDGTWSAVSDSAWLGVSPSSGTASLIAAQVGVDATGLGNGQYAGNITVDGSCIEGGPVVVPVTLDVIAGGNIEVTTNNEDASFNIDGPESYTGTGMSLNVSGATEGSYTVVFESVAGFKTPESCSLDVVNGETASCHGEYVDLREELNIIATTGGTKGLASNELVVYNGNGEYVGKVTLKDGTSKGYWDNAIAASGDVDGDGVEELIVSHDVGVVTGLRQDGSAVPGLNFRPFEDRTYVDLAVADLNGDGIDEIITGALNWSSNGAAVRVFGYDAVAQSVDTGVDFIAYTGADWALSQNNDRRGVRIAAGDIDGDGDEEILTVQGGGYSKHQVSVRMFNVENDWTVRRVGSIEVNDIKSYYSDVAAGDLDADGIAEVIISDAPMLTVSTQPIEIRAYSVTGELLAGTTVDSIRGVEVAAGDLDFDGAAEIVVGEGAFKEQKNLTSSVRVFEYDAVKSELVDTGVNFNAFEGQQVFGVRVATGLLGSE